MNQELEKYIDWAIADGEVDEKEKAVLIRKAKEVGIEEDELEMILKAKLHVINKSDKKAENNTTIAATKECPNCGAKNDVIFTNCIYCKTSLPHVDINALSNDTLVMNASQWIGNIDGINENRGLRIELESSTGANKFFGERDYKYISYGEVVGFAEKYLRLLEIRGAHNETLKSTAEDLRQKFRENLSNVGKKEKKWWLNYWTIVVIFLIVVITGGTIGIRGEVNTAKERYSKLDAIELKIENSIAEKNYEQALIQAEQLNWTWDLSNESNKKTAEQYDLKKENYKKSILKLLELKKEESNNGNN